MFTFLLVFFGVMVLNQLNAIGRALEEANYDRTADVLENDYDGWNN